MKGPFFITLVVIFSILVIPLSSLAQTNTDTMAVAKTEDNIPYNNDVPVRLETIKVLKDSTIIELSVNEYIFGVVAAEMPALYEEEALKAQAVAAYTFACYKKLTASDSEYDITSDPETAQCFITREEAIARWGEKADEYAKKIDNCITAVEGELLTYEGQPIFAAYHAISSGTTNSCGDVWGNNVPYLVSVNSSSDCLADGYLSEMVFSAEELGEKLKDISSPTGNPQNYFSDINITNNGYVKSIAYCSKQTTGASLCQALGLRSSNFEIKFSDDVFTFTVKGYGHGVGMSQTGADYMAKQGSSYKEILLHYYKGVTLQKN